MHCLKRGPSTHSKYSIQGIQWPFTLLNLNMAILIRTSMYWFEMKCEKQLQYTCICRKNTQSEQFLWKIILICLKITGNYFFQRNNEIQLYSLRVQQRLVLFSQNGLISNFSSNLSQWTILVQVWGYVVIHTSNNDSIWRTEIKIVSFENSKRFNFNIARHLLVFNLRRKTSK